VVTDAPTPPPPHRGTIRVILQGVVVVAVAAATVAVGSIFVAPAPAPAPAPVPVDEAAPRPTSTASAPAPSGSTSAIPTPSPEVIAPEPAVPLTCPELDRTAGIADEYSFELSYVSAESAATQAILLQNGTLLCTWQSAGGEIGDSWLSLTIQRRAPILEKQHADERHMPAHEVKSDYAYVVFDAFGRSDSWISCNVAQCNVDVVLDDYWVTGYFLNPVEEPWKAQTSRLTRALTDVISLVGGTRPGPDWRPPAGSWPNIVDCVAIDAATQVADAARVEHMSVTESTGYHEDYYELPEIASRGGTSACTWSSSDDSDSSDRRLSVYVSAVAGGAWALDVPLDARVIESELDDVSADRAVVHCRGEDCTVVAAIGANLLSISLFYDDYSQPSKGTLESVARAIIAGAASVYPS
jgi:hypothetical protein